MGIATMEILPSFILNWRGDTVNSFMNNFITLKDISTRCILHLKLYKYKYRIYAEFR